MTDDGGQPGGQPGVPPWLAANLNYCSRCGSALAFGPVRDRRGRRPGLWAEGQAMTLDQAVLYALTVSPPGRTGR